MSAQVRPGYKLAEVGVIPEDWAYVDLKSLSFDISDGNYSSKYPKASDFKYLGVPFIRANNIGAMTICDVDMRFISAEQHGELLKGHLKRNDILITTRGEIGQIALVPDHHIGSNINAQIVRINTDGSKIFNLFLAQFLTSKIATEQVVALQTGSALKQLPVGRLLQLKVLVPPHVEQREIAAALTDMDALISGLDQLIAKKRDIKQATMQQLLTGQQRLPGFSGEWEVRRLGELANLYQPVTISASQFSAFGYPVYGANGVVGFYPKFNHEKWQVTVTCRGSTCGTVNKSVNRSWITGNAMVINCDDRRDIDKNFMYYALTNKDLSICITGSGQPQIVRSPLAAIELPVPSELNEQTAIATILSDMDSELATLETRAGKTRQLKQGMMQELLTGKIRLR